MRLLKVLILIIIMLNINDLLSCDESTRFWKKDVREKKRFIKDFINNPDSICEPAFYDKYETFRIRNGFIEDYSEVFNKPWCKDVFLPHMENSWFYSMNGKSPAYYPGISYNPRDEKSHHC